MSIMVVNIAVWDSHLVSSTAKHRQVNPLNDPDIASIVSALTVTEGKDLMQKANVLMTALGNDVSTIVLVTGAQRLPTRFEQGIRDRLVNVVDFKPLTLHRCRFESHKQTRFGHRTALLKISFRKIYVKILVHWNKMDLIIV